MRDVTDIGRFETGNLSVEVCSVDATRCAEDSLAAVSALATKAGVVLSSTSTSPGLRLTADADRLHQCLVNLLTNAIKYNRRGGWIQIAIDDYGKQVSIAVRDGGLGMNPLQRKHFFEPFNRLGRQSAAAPGTGLGLVITRHLVETMGG
jgi:signal transduction histidine kinase